MVSATTTLGRMTATETRLFLRDRVGTGLAFLLPLGLLVVFGSIGMGDAAAQDDAPPAGFLPAMTLGLSVAMLGLTVLPTILATYREKGILRRLRTTPTHPSTVLIAQLIINLGAILITAVVIVVLAIMAFDLPAAGNWPGFVVSFVLMTTALLAVGLIIAAVSSTAKIATGAGMIIFFPSMFFAGVWTPGDLMPQWARPIRDVSPLGAGMEGMQSAWDGAWPSVTGIVALIVVTIVGSAIAARLFRWE